MIFCIINAQAYLKFLTCTPSCHRRPSVSALPINFIAKLDCFDRNQGMMGSTSLLDTETCLSSDFDPPPNKNLYCDWLPLLNYHSVCWSIVAWEIFLITCFQSKYLWGLRGKDPIIAAFHKLNRKYVLLVRCGACSQGGYAGARTKWHHVWLSRASSGSLLTIFGSPDFYLWSVTSISSLWSVNFQK